MAPGLLRVRHPPAGQRVGDVAGVAKLADQLAGRQPGGYCASAASVPHRIGCDLVHGEDQVSGCGGWKAGIPCPVGDELADAAQISVIPEYLGARRWRRKRQGAAFRHAAWPFVARARLVRVGTGDQRMRPARVRQDRVRQGCGIIRAQDLGAGGGERKVNQSLVPG